MKREPPIRRLAREALATYRAAKRGPISEPSHEQKWIHYSTPGGDDCTREEYISGVAASRERIASEQEAAVEVFAAACAVSVEDVFATQVLSAGDYIRMHGLSVCLWREF